MQAEAATALRDELTKYCEATPKNLDREQVLADPGWEAVRSKARAFVAAFESTRRSNGQLGQMPENSFFRKFSRDSGPATLRKGRRQSATASGLLQRPEKHQGCVSDVAICAKQSLATSR